LAEAGVLLKTPEALELEDAAATGIENVSLAVAQDFVTGGMFYVSYAARAGEGTPVG